MTVRISSLLLVRLIAEASASPDREICGLLLSSFRPAPGKARREADLEIDLAMSAANVSAHPADSFEIDPAALFATLRAERAGGAVVVGHYHSHPNGRAVPSPRDAAMAGEAGRLWLILGGGGATLWRAVPGGATEGAFEAVALCDVTRHKGAQDDGLERNAGL